jgi:ABC-2 type transport system permease protein
MTDSAETPQARRNRLATSPWQTDGSTGNLALGLTESVRDLWGHRELLGLLTRRELKARYKDSALGFLWSLARPLTQLLIYFVVVGQFLGAARNIENFAVFIFAGLTIYTLFSEIVGAGTGSIVANSGLVKKVYLPREIFPLATVGSALFNFAIQLAILLVVAGLSSTVASWPSILYGFGSLAIILIYATALAILLSALNVFLRDVQYLVEIGLLLAMWISPIVYSWTYVSATISGWLLEVYLNNPVTLAVLGFQKALWAEGSNGVMPPYLGVRMLIAIVIGLIFLIFAQRAFARRQGDFAQEL